MCTLGENLNVSACQDHHSRTDIFETENTANDENSISDNEISEILENFLEMGNSPIQENPENCEDPSIILSDIRRKNLNRPIIGHININVLESKFDALKVLIEDKLDVLVVTENK